jgi:S1-C subfamily serine protease
LGEEWFFESRRVKPKRSRISILVVILIVMNIAVVSYFVGNNYFDSESIKNEVEELNGELESLRFQIQSLNLEISSLRNSINIKNQGNGSSSFELTQIYSEASNSVVLISVQTTFGGGQGSGFVYDMKGRIITNHHVIEDAQDISVTFIDGTTATADLVGTDPYVDLAVIEVDLDEDAASSLLKPMVLGSSSELLVGERVVALGNPFGLSNTITAGIISAVGRQMNALGGFPIVDVIQTDAAINPGNSGGPLLNMKGEVIGMNTAIISETRQFSGIGFAIPSDTISREAQDLIDKGFYDHPYLGTSLLSLNLEIKEEMGLDPSTQGILVVEVVKGGPADKAGLKEGTQEITMEGFRYNIGGDIIIGVDDKTVKDYDDLVVYLERFKKPGDKIFLTLIRNREIIDVELILGIRPQP